MTEKKRGLGRGLAELGINELLSDIETSQNASLKKISIELVKPGKFQPRHFISQDALEELAASIKSHGIVQPILVRTISHNSYEIIAGERRWRAAQIAGLHEIPVVIQDLADDAALAVGLIENIQREDLNALEEANAMQRLISEFNLTHQEVADILGKSRVTVTNLLRLLELHPEVKDMLEQNRIEMGHGRALLVLPIEHQPHAANVVINKGLSVRATESLVKNFPPRQTSNRDPAQDPDIANFEKMLANKLGAKVTIQHTKNGNGKLTIKYNSLDELEGIVSYWH